MGPRSLLAQAPDLVFLIGLEIASVAEVLVRRLDQERPGELGRIAATLGEAGVNILTQYSDHANRLILVVDDLEAGEMATRDWA